MPAAQPTSISLNGLQASLHEPILLGTMTHTEAEIIDFAKFVDPLPLHVDPAAAKKSIFGGIIASGAMLYIEAHRRWFIPLLGPSIICGLGVRNWNFRKPHYPESPVQASLTPKGFDFHPERNSVQVEWYYTFHDAEGNLVQDLELPVLHWHRPAR